MKMCSYCGTDFEKNAPITSGDFFISPQESVVTYKGQPIKLSVTHINLLHAIAKSAPFPIRRDALLNRVSDGDNMNILSVHISTIRSRLMAAGIPSPFETVHDAGYRWIPC